MLLHWIWLATRPGMNDRIKAEVLRHFGDPEDAYYADPGAYAAVDGMTEEAAALLRDKDLKDAKAILEDCENQNIGILTFQDALYPNRLKNIADPPLVLYYKGKLPEFDALPVIAVVGTREATPYGLKTAKNLGAQIARCGGLVLSGLANGIDTMAMRGALSAGKAVVGLMGCGVDVVYPANNRSLLLDTQRYGCLLSEFPPGTPPYKWNFPKRNRVISGLSCGVVVVEAPKRSGALITASQAAEQGRDVFVIPGNVDVAACAGSNALLRDGAIAVSTGWDILSEYVALFPDQIRKDGLPSMQTLYPDEESAIRAAERPAEKVAQKPRYLKNKGAEKPEADKKAIDNEPKSLYSEKIDTEDPSLTGDERTILALLRDGERLVDDVIAESGLTSGTTLSTLTLLEVKGLIRRLPGRYVCLSR